jgi:shikimate dehydrogenase
MAPVYELGLLGFPLGHSLSPQLHQAALQAAGLKGEYHLFSIPPDQLDSDQRIKNLIEQVAVSECHGLNVTIPYKQKVIEYLDQLTPVASRIEAVNTIYFDHGQTIGDNTDVPGFLADITSKGTEKKNGIAAETFNMPDKVMVFGAGGSARAIVYAMATQGRQLIVLARRIEQAENLVESLKVQAPGIFKTEPVVDFMIPLNINQVIDDVDHRGILIINTTPMGMWPDIHRSPWPDTIKFPNKSLVYDLIYNPRETMLMKQAANSGLRAWNGLGMLVEQASLAFERWTGIHCSSEAMWNVMLSTDNL